MFTSRSRLPIIVATNRSHEKENPMKPIEPIKVVSRLISIAGLIFLASCANQTEGLLLQAGFRPLAVTTPKQQQAVGSLPKGRVSAVTNNGKIYYVYPTGNGQILVGGQAQYRMAQAIQMERAATASAIASVTASQVNTPVQWATPYPGTGVANPYYGGSDYGAYGPPLGSYANPVNPPGSPSNPIRVKVVPPTQGFAELPDN